MPFSNSDELPGGTNLLHRRDLLSKLILQDPYSVALYLQRSQTYRSLGFPDLSVFDAYKALLLIDEIKDEAGEYHEQSCTSLCRWQENASKDLLDVLRPDISLSKQAMGTLAIGANEAHKAQLSNFSQAARLTLAHNLASIGCLRTAYGYIQQASKSEESDEELENILEKIEQHFAAKDMTWFRTDLVVKDIPDNGHVRREVYPWNRHEADRFSPHALEVLNLEIKKVAPKLEVQLTELPVLTSGIIGDCAKTVKQLGLFATEDIAPGEQVLHERSLLTANARVHEPLCDACSSALPDLNGVRLPELGSLNVDDEKRELVPCPNDCEDTVFCSQTCLELAENSYHDAICGAPADVETLAKDVLPAEAANALYNQLLFRALAMAQTQNLHPLDLKEVKYIWGDFNGGSVMLNTLDPFHGGASAMYDGADPFHGSIRTLPFSFQTHILQPLTFLEKLDVNIFEVPNELAEMWVYNTLLAKFRGTASARISPRDGRPEVAAVHPLWCLANHSCDPNVGWEWAGEINFTTRESRREWKRKSAQNDEDEVKAARKGGIQKGGELLNHYVDIDLEVKDRREWGMGALGGACMCERCLWESAGGA